MTDTVLIRYPSLMQSLANRLGDALRALNLVPQHIPLQWLTAAEPHRLEQPGRFISPVALHWATTAQVSASELAHRCLAHLQAPGLTVWVEPPGWIHAAIEGSAIASYLQALTATVPQMRPRADWPPATHRQTLTDPELFPIQYAHARCCSLLQLAHRDGWLTLASPTAAPYLHVTTPQSWPWLTRNHQWQLHHPAEQHLIGQFLQFPSSLQSSKQAWLSTIPDVVPVPWPPPSRHLVQQAQLWSETFLAFERDCRLFGEDRHVDQGRCQARLGLVLATQHVLAWLLQEGLAVSAPQQL